MHQNKKVYGPLSPLRIYSWVIAFLASESQDCEHRVSLNVVAPQSFTKELLEYSQSLPGFQPFFVRRSLSERVIKFQQPRYFPGLDQRFASSSPLQQLRSWLLPSEKVELHGSGNSFGRKDVTLFLRFCYMF